MSNSALSTHVRERALHGVSATPAGLAAEVSWEKKTSNGKRPFAKYATCFSQIPHRVSTVRLSVGVGRYPVCRTKTKIIQVHKEQQASSRIQHTSRVQTGTAGAPITFSAHEGARREAHGQTKDPNVLTTNNKSSTAAFFHQLHKATHRLMRR